MTDYNHFFRNQLPEALEQLQPETKPLWGSMNAQEMIHHLRLGIKMSLENQEGSISTPTEKLASYKRFLMSDRPFGKNLERPEFFDEPVETDDLELLKAGFLEDLERLLQYFRNHPQHTSVHDSFGILDAAEWTHLHYKHFRHHFIQFGLIPE